MRVGSILACAAASLLLAAPACAADQVLYVGDSLGVGTTPGLARELGTSIDGDSRIGRPSPEGLGVLQQKFSPSDDIVVFDIGTNDDPSQPGRLAADLAAARRLTGKKCLIVATLNRPPLGGVPVDGLNNAVLAFASGSPNVQLVDWNAIASSEPDLLGPDRVHPTPQGYALRAQLFAEAVAACGATPPDQDLLTPTPTPKKPKPRKRERRIEVPGIEASGISFTEPLKFNGLTGELLLPNTKPPYPAVVMLNGSTKAAEFLAAHGIATLVMPFRNSFGDALSAAGVLGLRKDIRKNGVAVWGQGVGALAAARSTDRDSRVDAVVAISPSGVTPLSARDWAVRRELDAPAPAVTKWLELRGDDEDPSTAWRSVKEPVLAIWGTRDDRIPIRASAAAIRDALAAGANKDRTFRWFDASHGGAVTYKNGEPVYAPGMLEEISRWVGLRLGAKRAAAEVKTPLPPANGGPEPVVAEKSALLSLPLQLLWLLAPVALFGIALARGTQSVAVLVTGLGALVSIAYGVSRVLGSDGTAPPQVAGTPWPFALAFVLAGACALLSIRVALKRQWLLAAAGGLWTALALFWLV